MSIHPLPSHPDIPYTKGLKCKCCLALRNFTRTLKFILTFTSKGVLYHYMDHSENFQAWPLRIVAYLNYNVVGGYLDVENTQLHEHCWRLFSKLSDLAASHII